MKRRIRLSEGQLRRIIKEAVDDATPMNDHSHAYASEMYPIIDELGEELTKVYYDFWKKIPTERLTREQDEVFKALIDKFVDLKQGLRDFKKQFNGDDIADRIYRTAPSMHGFKLYEGQGWNKFKSATKDIFNGNYDNDLEYRNYNDYDDTEEEQNWIRNGGGSDNPNGKYDFYDKDGNWVIKQNGWDGTTRKPINKGFTGRLGRKAAALGIRGALAMRDGYNRMRGKY